MKETSLIRIWLIGPLLRKRNSDWCSLQISIKQRDLKKKLRVSFASEPGLDMGGLTKEWFQLLIREIFQPDYGYSLSNQYNRCIFQQIRLKSLGSMFIYYPNSRCYWFSTSQENNLKEYNLIGVLMGLAVYNRYLLPVHIRHYPISLWSKHPSHLSHCHLPKKANEFMNALCRQFISTPLGCSMFNVEQHYDDCISTVSY